MLASIKRENVDIYKTFLEKESVQLKVEISIKAVILHAMCVCPI